MILDTLTNADRYTALHPLFPAAFDYLRNTNLAALPLARVPIQGDTLFALPQRHTGRRRDEATLEAHRRYIDIQYIVTGREDMGWRPTSACSRIRSPYDPTKDFIFFDDPPETWFTVPSGAFVIFYPEDAHAPSVADHAIFKVVLKVAV